MIRVFVVCVMATLSSLAVADAMTVRYAGGMMESQVPNAWSSEETKDGVWLLAGPGRRASITGVATEDDNIESAAGIAIGLVEGSMSDAVFTAPETTLLNGMERLAMGGTAKSDGQHFEVEIQLVRMPSKRFLILITMMAENATPADREGAATFIERLLPLRETDPIFPAMRRLFDEMAAAIAEQSEDRFRSVWHAEGYDKDVTGGRGAPGSALYTRGVEQNWEYVPREIGTTTRGRSQFVPCTVVNGTKRVDAYALVVERRTGQQLVLTISSDLAAIYELATRYDLGEPLDGRPPPRQPDE